MTNLRYIVAGIVIIVIGLFAFSVYMGIDKGIKQLKEHDLIFMSDTPLKGHGDG